MAIADTCSDDFLDSLEEITKKDSAFEVILNKKSRGVTVIYFNKDKNFEKAYKFVLRRFKNLMLEYKIPPIMDVEYAEDGIVLKWLILISE
jgi:hypothetical protein